MTATTCPRAHRPAGRYRRRRLVALVIVGLMASLAQRAMTSALDGERLTTPHEAASEPVYVVQPGDTLWEVARALRPEGDLRATVDRLAAEHGRGALQVGERIGL